VNDIRAPQAAAYPISADAVRYIKLGKAGRDEGECIQSGWMRIGHHSGDAGIYDLCRAGDWASFHAAQRALGKAKGRATDITGQVQAFYEDEGRTLWFTFRGEKLFWGFADCRAAPVARDDGGSWRPMLTGWHALDRDGRELRKDNLPGEITRTAGYQGTSCSVRDPNVQAALFRRINAERAPEEIRAEEARKTYADAVLHLVRRLGPADFELLVDLMLSNLGWRRQNDVGGTQKTQDISLRQPLTGERAMVQVKTSTTRREFETYAAIFRELGEFDRLFYVYHTGDLSKVAIGPNEVLIGPERLAELVVDAGLYDWVLGKVL